MSGRVGTVPDRAVPVWAVSPCRPDTGTPLLIEAGPVCAGWQPASRLQCTHVCPWSPKAILQVATLDSEGYGLAHELKHELEHELDYELDYELEYELGYELG